MEPDISFKKFTLFRLLKVWKLKKKNLSVLGIETLLNVGSWIRYLWWILDILIWKQESISDSR